MYIVVIIKSLWVSNCNFWIKWLSYPIYPVYLVWLIPPPPNQKTVPVWPPLQVVATYSIVPFDKLLMLYTCMYYIFHCSLKQSRYTIIWFILLSVHCHIVNQIYTLPYQVNFLFWFLIGNEQVVALNRIRMYSLIQCVYTFVSCTYW